MQKLNYRIDGEILYISLEGRIDASNAFDVDDAISSIKAEHPDTHTIIDADNLTYISSAGLRILLKLRKAEKDLAVINVSPEVYDIFSMTGFTDMINIQKAYRRMSIDGCTFLAKGANGAVYRYDDETIVKTYFNPNALPEIQQERENARRAFVLGINTAIPYDIVRIGDGYGSVTELLNACALSKLVIDDPENIDLPVKYFIDLLKDIHTTEPNAGEFPDMKAIALDWVSFIAPQLSEAHANKLTAMVNEVPSQNTLLHGDYHTNNVLIQNNEPLLIDLDTLCMGHPVFELASMYNAFVGFQELSPENASNFLGFDFATSALFWRKSLEAYFNTTDAEYIDGIEKKAQILGYVRLLRRALRRPNQAESPAMIEHTKKQLAILIEQVDSLYF